MESYNNFSGAQRAANGAALRKAIAAGTVPAPVGPCALCGDPDVPLEYHSEDYSKPYNWSVPAAYPLCIGCHRHKLHKRFAKPEMWEAFKAHVRRGGYARDLRQADIAKEVEQYIVAHRAGQEFNLRPLRPYAHADGTQWWEKLDSRL